MKPGTITLEAVEYGKRHHIGSCRATIRQRLRFLFGAPCWLTIDVDAWRKSLEERTKAAAKEKTNE